MYSACGYRCASPTQRRIAPRTAIPPAAIRESTLPDPRDKERGAALLVAEGDPLDALEDALVGAVLEPEGAVEEPEAVREPDSTTVDAVPLEVVAGAAEGEA